MTKFDRRTFLRHSTLAGGALFGLQGLIARTTLAQPANARAFKGSGGYGPLIPTLTENTNEELLALPEGFKYKVFGKVGTPMSDGYLTPPRHDGMAAFAVGGQIRLVRNHEVRGNAPSPALFPIGDPSKSYDVSAGGGTTTLIVDPTTRELVRDFVSLSGTHTNCAGGPTPWGSWITCEETNFGTDRGFSQSHGYCYEVSAAANGQVTPVPIKAMGRFFHEALAIDPATGIVYLTEDTGSAVVTAGFYRFIPDEPGNLATGGRLQMLALRHRPNYDTRAGQMGLLGRRLLTRWVDINDPDPPDAEADTLAVYKQGFAKGGATFARLEGCWHSNGYIFFDATNGGDAGLGQIWQYRPVNRSSGHLTLIFESPSVDVLDKPDNLCVSPRGGLLLCEDGSGEQFLRGLTTRGRIFDFARNLVYNRDANGNLIVPLESNEFAGATFSADGETLFVNILTPGMTFAIWGPWEEGAL